MMCLCSDSDESPVATRERTIIVHANPHQLSLCQEDLSISGRLSHTRDSGCQTDDFLIACKFLKRLKIHAYTTYSTRTPHSNGLLMAMAVSQKKLRNTEHQTRIE